MGVAGGSRGWPRHASSSSSHRYQSDPLKHLAPTAELPELSAGAAEVSTDQDNYLVPDWRPPDAAVTPEHEPELSYTPVVCATGSPGTIASNSLCPAQSVVFENVGSGPVGPILHQFSKFFSLMLLKIR